MTRACGTGKRSEKMPNAVRLAWPCTRIRPLAHVRTSAAALSARSASPSPSSPALAASPLLGGDVALTRSFVSCSSCSRCRSSSSTSSSSSSSEWYATSALRREEPAGVSVIVMGHDTHTDHPTQQALTLRRFPASGPCPRAAVPCSSLAAATAPVRAGGIACEMEAEARAWGIHR